MAVLGSTTLTGCSSIPDFLATSSITTFQQTAAPTSWTKITTVNDATLRVVSGTASSGGTTAFTTVFTSRSVTGSVDTATLAVANIPAHTHPNATSARNYTGGPGSGITPTTITGPAGGGGGHTHPFTGINQDFAVLYVDIILASKN
jgi:hypothetical protein